MKVIVAHDHQRIWMRLLQELAQPSALFEPCGHEWRLLLRWQARQTEKEGVVGHAEDGDDVGHERLNQTDNMTRPNTWRLLTCSWALGAQSSG